jgi:hypothetical protein
MNHILEANMSDFESGSYSDIPVDFSDELWRFLNSKESLIRFDTATFLRKPALQALQQQLLEKFDARIRKDRIKQMTGRMVRQIMERNGYRLEQTGVRITDGLLFSSAARYTR